MAVTMADITKLRKMSGAGMMDCKKALTESDGDIEKAMEIIRKKGQAIAANVLIVRLPRVVCWLRRMASSPLSSL